MSTLYVYTYIHICICIILKYVKFLNKSMYIFLYINKTIITNKSEKQSGNRYKKSIPNN